MVLFTFESSQITIPTDFFSVTLPSVALIRPKIYRKLIQNGGNRAERQNKQKIIHLNEYLSDSSEMKGEF